MTPLILILTLIVAYLGTAYWFIEIRGIHPVSSELSGIINSIISDKNTIVEKYGPHHKVFKSADTVMRIWSVNWPYAYGSEGSIKQDNEIVYKWSNMNPTYKTRKAVRDFK